MNNEKGIYMELESLRKSWHTLDGRLYDDTRLTGMTAEAANAKIAKFRALLRRQLRLKIMVLCLMPLFLWLVTERLHTNASEWAKVVIWVLLAAVVINGIVRLAQSWQLLRRIDPARASVRDTCVAVLRFRRQYLYGLTVGMVFGVALIIMYGVYLSAAASPYFIVGFAVGVALGLFLGVWKLRRSWRQLNELREDTMEV